VYEPRQVLALEDLKSKGENECPASSK
jgi:hypothetical protein